MIDCKPTAVRALRNIPELGRRVFNGWPEGDPKPKPMAVVSTISSVPVFTDRQGRERLTSVAYSVDIIAKTARECDLIGERAADILSAYNLVRTGWNGPYYDDLLQAYAVSMTVSGTVAHDGTTFRE